MGVINTSNDSPQNFLKWIECMTNIHKVVVMMSNIIRLTRQISGVIIIITVPSTLAWALNHIWFKEYSSSTSCNLWSSFVMSRALGHSWRWRSARVFARFFYWRHRLARSSTIISTNGFGSTHSVSFIELNMSTTQKLVSCGSSSIVVLSHYLWYWVPMPIQNFKISKIGSLLANFLLVCFSHKIFLTYFHLCEISKVCSGWVCYFECLVLRCVMFTVFKLY